VVLRWLVTQICVVSEGYHSISFGFTASVAPNYYELGVPQIAPTDGQKENLIMLLA